MPGGPGSPVSAPRNVQGHTLVRPAMGRPVLDGCRVALFRRTTIALWYSEAPSDRTIPHLGRLRYVKSCERPEFWRSAMSRPIVLALLMSFAVLAGGTASAGDGGSHGRRIVDKPGPGFGSGHEFRRPHRVPFFPIYRLGRGGDVNVVVQQTVVSVQALPAVP